MKVEISFHGASVCDYMIFSARLVKPEFMNSDGRWLGCFGIAGCKVLVKCVITKSHWVMNAVIPEEEECFKGRTGFNDWIDVALKKENKELNKFADYLVELTD